jgi:hypothetical protein
MKPRLASNFTILLSQPPSAGITHKNHSIQNYLGSNLTEIRKKLKISGPY